MYVCTLIHSINMSRYIYPSSALIIKRAGPFIIISINQSSFSFVLQQKLHMLVQLNLKNIVPNQDQLVFLPFYFRFIIVQCRIAVFNYVFKDFFSSFALSANRFLIFKYSFRIFCQMAKFYMHLQNHSLHLSYFEKDRLHENSFSKKFNIHGRRMFQYCQCQCTVSNRCLCKIFCLCHF